MLSFQQKDMTDSSMATIIYTNCITKSMMINAHQGHCSENYTDFSLYQRDPVKLSIRLFNLRARSYWTANKWLITNINYNKLHIS